jgi:FkbM family methyltransferase
MTKNRIHPSTFYVRSVLGKVWRHPNNRHRRVRACAKAVGWQVYKRTVRRPITVRAYGGMRVTCHSDSTAAADLIYFGELYEYDEMSFCRKYLRSGDTVIDGGANIGTFTLFLASLVRPGGQVLAIEPDATAARRLRENVTGNGLEGSVRVFQAALAEEPGTASFSTGWDVANRLVPGRLRPGLIEVPTTTLDLLARDIGEIAFAKLDLEGGEHHALMGAARMLGGRVIVWMVEGIDWRVREAGGSHREMLALLSRSGYGFGTYNAGTAQMERIDASQVTMANFFAISEAKWEMVEQRLA